MADAAPGAAARGPGAAGAGRGWPVHRPYGGAVGPYGARPHTGGYPAPFPASAASRSSTFRWMWFMLRSQRSVSVARAA